MSAVEFQELNRIWYGLEHRQRRLHWTSFAVGACAIGIMVLTAAWYLGL